MNLGENNILGGYLLLDFKGVPLTSSFKLTKGVREALERNGDRPVVLVNVYKDGTPYRDTYCENRMQGSNYVLYAHGFKITVNSNSQSKIEADELHQQVDALEDRVDLLEENVDDINQTLTPAGLLDKLIEGSEYISVDENEAGTKVRVELDETKFDEEPTEDSDNLITSGAVYDAFAERPYRTIYKDGDAKLGPTDAKGISFNGGQNVNIVSSEDTAGNVTLTFNATAGGETQSDVFWATRGTTTAAEIATAVGDGKIVKFVYSGYEYSLANTTSTYYYFSNATTSAIKQITLRRADNTWSGVASVNIQKELTAGAGITIDSNNVISTKTLLAPYHNYIKVRFSIGEGARYRGMTMQFDVFSTVDYEAEQISTIEDLAELMYADQIRDIEIPCTGHYSMTNSYGTVGKYLPYATGVYVQDDVHRIWVKACSLGDSGDLVDEAVNIDNAFNATVSIKTQKIYD